MAEIKKYPKDRLFMLELSENELDKILEIGIKLEYSVNETIIGSFQNGIIKMQESFHEEFPQS